MSISKKHINIYVIADNETNPDFETDLELNLALNSIRARCYSSNITSSETFDWGLRSDINMAAINGCDIIVVLGDKITKDMETSLELVNKTDKEIFCLSKKVKKWLAKRNFKIAQISFSERCSTAARIPSEA